jgi:alpha-beta hydrolase superfamily lysophospholipase
MHPEMRPPSHRRRGRWITAGLTAVALVATACSGASGSGGAATTSSAQAQATTTTTTAMALQPLEQPNTRCGPPATKASLLRFLAADGTSLDGVMVGGGTAGVVLAHEYPADLCGFWPFADYLAKRGLRAFDIDLRCFGLSACPEGDARGRVVDDIAAAVAELRRRGVTSVALVGASMGGAAVLIAGTRIQPPVAAVVELSGEVDPTNLVGGIPLNAGAAVKRLAVPTMLVVATNDRYTSVEETRAMYRAVKARDKRLEVLSGPFDGLHGWQLLNNATGAGFTPVASRVASFIASHTRG